MRTVGKQGEDGGATPSRVLAPALSRAEWDESYTLLAPSVYGIAFRVTRCRPAAEEICQDVFVKLWLGDGYDPAKGSVRTWLNVMAHRRAVDWVRREVALQNRVRRAGLGDDGVIEPGEIVELRDRGVAVRAALDRLPPAQNEAIRLAYFEGFTHVEISTVTGAPLGTIKSRIRDGMRRLGHLITEIDQHTVPAGAPPFHVSLAS